MTFFKNISAIKSDNCRNAANEFLTIATTVVRNIESYYGSRQFAGYQLFGKESNSDNSQNTRYDIELIYPLNEAENQETSPGTTFRNWSTDALGFTFTAVSRDSDDSFPHYKHPDMGVYFLDEALKDAGCVYITGFRLLNAGEYARIAKMMDDLRARRTRELVFQRIIDNAK